VEKEFLQACQSVAATPLGLCNSVSAHVDFSEGVPLNAEGSWEGVPEHVRCTLEQVKIRRLECKMK
jgi:hypothetical protein